MKKRSMKHRSHPARLGNRGRLCFCVYAAAVCAGIPGNVPEGHLGPGVAVLERPILLVIGKQRGQIPVAGKVVWGAFDPGNQFFDMAAVPAGPGVNGGAQCHGELAQLRENRVFRGELQRLHEPLLQLGEEEQRPAQKCHFSLNGTALGQPGDGLVHHGLEDAGGNVLLPGALVQ